MLVECDVTPPEGYEIVRIGLPSPSDWVMDYHGRAIRVPARDLNIAWMILRPIWQWPEWLTAPYIAMDSDGIWYAYTKEPSAVDDDWCYGGCDWLLLSDRTLLAFTPPPCTDWKTSLRRNPRLEVTP